MCVGELPLGYKLAIDDPNVIFTGRINRDKLLGYLSNSVALLFTSIHEGNPHAIFEAVSCFTPVICHDIYGMRRLTQKVSLKIPLFDYAQSCTAFAEALNRLQTSQFDKQHFIQFLEANSWDVLADRICQCYTDLLEEEPK